MRTSSVSPAARLPRARHTLATGLCLLLLNSPAAARGFIEGDGTMASFHGPRVPEPMIFDLVRPLGARRGELEINTLTERSLNGGATEWAPEIEYAVLDGLALEFELPVADTRLEEWKFAAQGTFGVWDDYPVIHGWQVIGRLDRHDGGDSVDILYLVGATLGGAWSTMNMFGVRRDGFDAGEYVGVMNNSIFFEHSTRVTLGLEANWEVDEHFGWRGRIVPQVHADLSKHLTVQLGAGVSWLTGETHGVVAGRLIYAF